MNALTPHHIPRFIPGADGSDPLLIAMAATLVVGLLLVGVFYFKLHSLPEHMAHRLNSGQLQLISILTVLALFTHNGVFWVLALLIAVVRIPDFLTPLRSIARSLSKLATTNDHPKKNNQPTAQED